jgi:hypothetical protein
MSAPCHQSNWRILVFRHAPLGQAVADAQRRQEHLDLPGQRLDRGMVEVIVVVMREQHAADRRELVDGDRWRMETLRPGPLHRRRALGKHRVGQPPVPTQLQQDRRMPEPVQAAIGRGIELRARECVHRHRRMRLGVLRLVEEEIPHHLRAGLRHVGWLRRGVAELAVDELRGVGVVADRSVQAQGSGQGDQSDEGKRPPQATTTRGTQDRIAVDGKGRRHAANDMGTQQAQASARDLRRIYATPRPGHGGFMAPTSRICGWR